MALYNEILVGRFNRALQKMLSMKGGAVSPQLGAEIVPGFTVGDISDVCDRWLLSWSTFAILSRTPAAAAQTGQCRIRNPRGSNVVAVIESVVLLEPAADPQVLVSHDVDSAGPYADLTTLDTQVRGQNFDNRGNPGSTCIVSHQAGAIPLNCSMFRLGVGAGLSVELIDTPHQELVLTPGDVWQFGSGVVNQVFECSIQWRERFIEESERS